MVVQITHLNKHIRLRNQIRIKNGVGLTQPQISKRVPRLFKSSVRDIYVTHSTNEGILNTNNVMVLQVQVQNRHQYHVLYSFEKYSTQNDATQLMQGMTTLETITILCSKHLKPVWLTKVENLSEQSRNKAPY